MKDILHFIIGIITGILIGISLISAGGHSPVQSDTKIDSFNEPQATVEQIITMHYIKNNFDKDNQLIFEHSDGIITKADYDKVLDRVRRKIAMDGIRETLKAKP
jgi:hypothetical protein